MPQGRVGLFVGRLKWFNGAWQLTNPESRMYGDQADDAFARMPDLIPIYPAVGRHQPVEPRERHRDWPSTSSRTSPTCCRRRCARPRTSLDDRQALRGIHRPDSWGQKVKAAETG